MSGKKEFQTKFPEEENTDSGYLSGRIEVKEEDEEAFSDSAKVECVYEDEEPLDSGLGLSENLDKLKISSETAEPKAVPEIVVDYENNDLPPLTILYEQDIDGDTQLHIAAAHGCDKSIATLIKLCPDRRLLHIRNDDGQTALHLAALCGKPVIARMLVRAGVPVGVRDRKGQTALHIATMKKDVDCLTALLKPTEFNNKKALAAIANIKDYRGQACVHIAAASGDLNTLHTLAYFKADLNSRENLSGATPLHIAARRGDVRMVTWLLRRPDVDRTRRDYALRSPRRAAINTPASAAFAAARLPESEDEDDEEVCCYESEEEENYRWMLSKLLETRSPVDVA